MRTVHLAFLTNFILLGFIWPQAAPSKSETELYLLEDSRHQQWCVFRSKSLWESEVKALPALSVGSLEYEKHRLSAVNVTQEDETGDWIIYDHHSLDKDGTPDKLIRTINVLPRDFSETQLYVIQDG